MSELIKICILTIPDRESHLTNAQFEQFVQVIAPVFKEKFPDIEFMFMSRELNLISSGLDQFERLLFEIKSSIDELKEMRNNTSNQSKNEETKE